MEKLLKKLIDIIRIETILFIRDFFGFFFTFVFPAFMLLLYGSIYGNDPSPYFNGLGTMDVSVPAFSAMIIGVTGLMAFPLTIAGYKDSGVYKRFDATPAGKGIVIAAQAAVNFCMTIAGFLILFLIGKLVYDIRIEGAVAAIGLALLLSIASIFALGFLFTAISPNARISNLLCYVSYFVMIFLSGATMPKEMLPDTIRSFSVVLPLTHVVELLQGTFRNASFSEYKNNVIVLSLLMVICLLTGAWLYRKKNWV